MRHVSTHFLVAFGLFALTACGDSGTQTDPSPAADKADGTLVSPDTNEDKAMTDLDVAVEVFRSAHEDMTRLVTASIDAQIEVVVKAGDLDVAAALTKHKDALLNEGRLQPDAPEYAEAFHHASTRLASAGAHALALYELAIDQKTRELEVEKALELRGVANALRAELPWNTEQLDVLTDPNAQWRVETYELAVDAKQNAQNNKLVLDEGFAKGDVLYIFPNTEDKWYTGKGKWCGYRERLAGAGVAPTMKLKINYGKTTPPKTSIGHRLILLASNPLKLYCEDRWPDNNKGQIRVTVVALRK